MGKKQKWLTSWVPHRLELLLSPAWSLSPVPLRRVLERLEVEHLRHGGYNNGELFVSFGQFVKAGVSRRNVLPILNLGQALGLLETIRPADHIGDLRAPNAYRLTYVPAKGASAPTDEWKRITADRANQLIAAFRQTDKESCETRARRAA